MKYAAQYAKGISKTAAVDPRLLLGLGGLGAGTAAYLATQPEPLKDLQDKRHRTDALTNLGLMAGGGTLAGTLAGQALHSRWGNEYPEGLVRNLIRRPVGRVVTNVAPPVGYGTREKLQIIRDAGGLPAAVKAVVTDKPLYARPDIIRPGVDKEHMDAEDLWMAIQREPLYRSLFDLKPRVINNVDPYRAVAPYPGQPKRFFVRNPEDKANLAAEAARASGAGDLGKTNLLATYLMKGEGPGRVSYHDVWDLKLNPDEKVIVPRGSTEAHKYHKMTGVPIPFSGKEVNLSFLARKLMGLVENPPVVEGTVSQGPRGWQVDQPSELPIQPGSGRIGQ
jgi:hypothetical protein